MKRVMVILVVALIVGAAAFVIGQKMGKKSALKAINGGTDNGIAVEEEEEPAAVV